MEQARTTKTQRTEDEEHEGGGMQRVPEECLAMAIGLTSPADACRAAAVSAAFRSAADSDAVWERFLPPDCDAILERAVHLVDSSSKKELFMDLSDEHVLLDDGKRSFGLQRSTGAKCYMLSVSDMGIAWGHTDLYWRELSDPDARSKVAELVSVCWLGLSGRISSKELSPGTHYAGYLVFKLTHDAHGLSAPRQVSYVEVDGQVVAGSVRTPSFHPCNRAAASCGEAGEPHEHAEEDGVGGVRRYPRQRDDGWLELVIGDYHTGTGDDDVGADIKMELHEWEELKWKKGLIIQGTEFRPKQT
ncbi:putative F-box protein PP2-B12 [Triticum dicoccoides]|uniref:F-box domain-containing protein n=1 Tax=Triticum turgidum subsp. durum TaxID=4567 RepID=A0A9R0XPK7_TRITD|nr:putative F-box protein PP2-B12 [Triticum dicoccoides]VAI40663.1 unnamed protein product [Triticum turgidum subsp. durum]